MQVNLITVLMDGEDMPKMLDLRKKSFNKSIKTGRFVITELMQRQHSKS